jgi:phospholipid/cholesterol/gamma-HCH transport system permease protein
MVRAVGRFALLAWECLGCLPQLRRADVCEHAFEVVGRSAFFICLTLGCTGAIMIVQAAGQAAGVLGDTGPIGAVFVQILISDFGPLVTGLLLAARFGAGVAAGLAAMVVTEQVDALRLCGAHPIPTLVAPRMWGGILGTLPMVVLGSLAAWGAGALVACLAYGVQLETFANLQLTHPIDLVVGVCKSLLFGAAVPLVSAQAGLEATGGAPAVGNVTTQAVIRTSVVLLGLDFMVSALAYAWTA